ncbi:MAG TPA: ChaN family lipoprotein [Pyrinomonadaceae bacterium]|nr:ChaN family lipoprotein [Pyrinomonadaceae bacterium]
MKRARLRLLSLAGALFIVSFGASAQTAQPQASPPPLRIYNAEGKTASLEDVVAAMSAAQVVFIGETHNDPAAHWSELQLLQGAFMRYGAARAEGARSVVLSLEMFERDTQAVLDEYLAGLIAERHFLAASRPWRNYETDYRPLVEFARTHKLPVVAANAPERYVSRVGRLGRESLRELSTEAKRWLPPLPYAQASAAYASKFKQVMGDMTAAGAHGSPFLLDAQALRDATMAHSLAEQLRATPRALVIHVNGNFHSEAGLGTPEHLRAYRADARTLVVTILPGKSGSPTDASSLKGLGDFVIVTGEAAATQQSF